MRKVLFNFIWFALVCCLIVVLLSIYIKPTSKLTLEYEPVNVEQKIKEMVMQLKNETVLTENDIEAIIKQHLDPQLTQNIKIEGAQFYLQNDQLHATMHVKWHDQVDVELKALYAFNWVEPTIMLTPISLHVKDIPLPNSWLEPVQFELYETDQALIKIDSLDNINREIVIRWKLDIF